MDDARKAAAHLALAKQGIRPVTNFYAALRLLGGKN